MNFYRCNKCGKIFFESENPKCCGETCELLKANTVDAAKEKHVPFCKIEGNIVNVSIGEVKHPMENDHFIEFIAMVKDDSIEKIDLKPNMEPVATFEYKSGATIYEYCNKHGLWKKDI